MKLSFFLLSVTVIVSAACTSVAKDEIKEFLPGVYVREAKHEFGAEHDTISITLLNASSNEYKIVRRWSYERILDGKPLEPEYKVTDKTGVYSSETKMLQEASTLETYSFNPKQNLMFSGDTKYLKLK